MESHLDKQSADARQPSGPSFKKSLAVAAVAASLGVSLGVPVGEALAANTTLESPPAPMSRQDKDNIASGQMKYSTQSKLSNQQKQLQSSQLKFNTQQSIPGK